MKKCKICGNTLVKKSDTTEYCSTKCFKVYINSKEFDEELNEILGIKKEDGKKSNNI